MDLPGYNHLKLEQDTTLLAREESTLEKMPLEKHLNKEVSKPEQEYIPEVSLPSKKSSAEKNKPFKKFVPSPTDSIQFNLKTKLNRQDGIINNTVVKDFLEPISQSDKVWIKGAVKAQARRL